MSKRLRKAFQGFNKLNLKNKWKEAKYKSYVGLIQLITSTAVSIAAILLKNHPNWIVLLAFIALIFSGINFWLKDKDEDLILCLAENIDLEKEINKLKEELNKFSDNICQVNVLGKILTVISGSSFEFFKDFKKVQDPNLLKKFLTDIIYKLIFKNFSKIFARFPDEYFSVALYLADESHKILWDFGVGAKSVEISTEYKPGRPWTFDDNGHVCICRRDKEPLVHYNIEKQIRENGLKPKHYQETDSKHYVSAITIPIYYSNRDAVRGVFCITSNKESCFYYKDLNCEDSEVNAINLLYETKIDHLRTVVELIALLFDIVYGDKNPEIPLDRENKIKEYFTSKNNSIP